MSAGSARATSPGTNGEIAYVDGNTGALFTVRPDGTDVKQLTSPPTGGPPNDQSVAWSPDGSHLSYTRNNNGVSLHVIRLDGSGDQTLLTQGGNIPYLQWDGGTSWSPDGSQIAFVGNLSGCCGASSILVVPATGGTPVQLTHDTSDVDPSWSPDGSKIAFTQSTPGPTTGMCESAVWTVNADGTHEEMLTPPVTYQCRGGAANYVYGADWSPDGSKVVFTHEYCATPTSITCTDDTVVYTLATGTEQTVDTSSCDAADCSWVSFSPDGGLLARSSELTSTSSSTLQILSADGSGKAISIASDVAREPTVAWQPVPQPVADPATDVLNTTATVNGMIQPALLAPQVGPTTYYFEYGVEDFSHASPVQTASSGTAPVMVSADLSGLAPNTAYQYRLVVSDADGIFRSDPLSLTTLGPPAAETGGVSGVAGTSATLLGTVDPDGPGTTANFEYGPAAAGGGFGGFSASTAAQSVGGGREPINVSAGITGLLPGQTYYYRLDATNQYGSVQGATESFQVPASPPSPGAPQVCSANTGPPFVLTQAPAGSGSLGAGERAALQDYAAQLRKTISELESHRTGPLQERSEFTVKIDQAKAELKAVNRALAEGNDQALVPHELPRDQLTPEQADLLQRAGCSLLNEYMDSLTSYVKEHGSKNQDAALELIGKLGDLRTVLDGDASDSDKQKLLDENVVELFGKFGMGVGGKKGEEIATLIGTLETDFHNAVSASSITAYKRTILAAAKKIAGSDGQTLAGKLFTLYDLVKGNLSDEQKWELLKDNIVNLADYLAGTEVLKIPQVRAATLGFELGRPFGDAIARDLKLIAEKELAEECLTAIAKKQEDEGIPTLGNLVNVDFGTATEATIKRGIFGHEWFCRVLPDSVAEGVNGAVIEVERAPSVFEVKGFRLEWGHEKFYFDTFFSGVQTNK